LVCPPSVCLSVQRVSAVSQTVVIVTDIHGISISDGPMGVNSVP